MQLLVIRHAVAEDREVFARTGQDDDLRPLTAEGKREMERVAKGLTFAASEIAILASSKLVRAQQTAAIVAKAYGIQRIVELDALAPDASPKALLEWLRGIHDKDEPRGAVAIVGHEPHLSEVAAWLLTGEKARIALKKGGACRLDFDSRPAAGRAELRWLMTPSLLRRLGE